MFRLLPFLLLALTACQSVPEKSIPYYKTTISRRISNDTFIMVVNNPVNCPLTVFATAPPGRLTNDSSGRVALYLPPLATDSLMIPLTQDTSGLLSAITYRRDYGHQGPPQDGQTSGFALPYPSGTKERIMQGYGGSFSHQRVSSRYALDFALSPGDTICAADDGVVVGVVEGYEHGGGSVKWRPYANLIMLYHPERDLYTQYAHLLHQGSIVALGDSVVRGQPIGLTGETGFTSAPHLHFNVFRITDRVWTSTPVSFGKTSLLPGAKLVRGSSWSNGEPRPRPD